jgi:hypothetical protein
VKFAGYVDRKWIFIHHNGVVLGSGVPHYK